MTNPLLTPDLGTGSLEHRDRVDFRELRRARADRLFALMTDLGIDACIFGREANARYATGVRRLWTASTRAFVPACFVQLAAREAHLLSFSASYEGIPEEIAPDHYFPVTWNPMQMIERLRALDGASSIRRLGVDGMTPLFRDLLAVAFPGVELVGIEPQLRDMRRIKFDAEVTCVRIAAATAESALVAAIRAARPGVALKQLQAAYLERMSVLGTSQFAQQGTFAPIGANGSLRWITPVDALADNVPLALAGGSLWAGYEGSLARTWWHGSQPPTAALRSAASEWRDTTARVVEALKPGASGADVLRAFGTGGRGDHTVRSVHALGLGHEGAIATPWLDPATLDAEQVQAGMVLAVRELVASDAGGYLGEDMVFIGPSGAEAITTLANGPLAG